MKSKAAPRKLMDLTKPRRRKKMSAEQLLNAGGYISTLQAAAMIGVLVGGTAVARRMRRRAVHYGHSAR